MLTERRITGAAEDEIDWDDEDDAAKTSASAPAKKEEAKQPAETKKAPAPTPAVAEPAPAKEAAQPAAPAETALESGDAPATQDGEAATDKPAEPPSNFALGLAATSADEEAKKREARAKRFGIVESSEDAKKAERAQRFGVDQATIVKGLDSALPERRPKRGRDRGDEGEGGGKRATPDRRGDGQQRGGRGGQGRKFRGGRGGGGGGGGAPRDQQRGPQGGGAPKKNILDDPEEKRKAEARAKRFGGA